MKPTISFHQQLQSKILFVVNSIIVMFLIPLAVATFLSNQFSTMTIAIIGTTILCISLFLQYLGYFVVASYTTTLTLILSAFLALISRTEITADLVYLFVSYQVIPLTLAGILAQNRVFSISLTGLVLLLLSYYIISYQGPIIGFTHYVQIIGSYVCISVIALLSDQTYLLSGKIMNRFHEEQQISKDKNKKIQDIIKIYQENQESGDNLEKVTIDNDTLAGQLNELFQKFTEDMHSLNQYLKDTNLRNDNIANSSTNILKVFANHKDNITEYKNKIEYISETSQEIDYIVQDRKVQMNELIELSTKGGAYMQESISAVEKVSENTKNMVDMISLIMEVAEKTNILALNAAVEASRAGKYGGGFAIVAKEIKALSTETTLNADTINRSLQNNIATISEAVNVIRSVGQSFIHLNESIMDFSSAIDQIVVKINSLTQQNAQMSIETKNTLSLITEVQNVVEKTVNSMQQGQQKIASIQHLSTVVDKDVKDIHQTTSSISDSGRKVQEKYKEYKYSVQKVEDIIEDISTASPYESQY